MARDVDTIQDEIEQFKQRFEANETKIADLKELQDDLECENVSIEDSISVLEDEIENLLGDENNDT